MTDNGDVTLTNTTRPSTSWESLTPTSFKNTVYIPSLKILVTAGSFVRYSSSTGHGSQCVGRIVEVVTSIDLVPNDERLSLIHLAPPGGTLANEIPVQFAKVNIFQDRQSFSSCIFPAVENDRFHGWQRIVQVDTFDWIPSYLIVGLAFVAFEDYDAAFDDCKGMSNFYVAKYRITGRSNVSVIPRHTCPPYPGRIESFQKLWSVDYCELTFNTIRQIRQEMQRILCRIAQSQGDFSMKNTKLHLPSCTWYFIKNAMAAEGVDCISTVKYSQPRAFLSWGLAYHSCRHTGYLDVLRFDTAKKLNAFRGLFGKMAGYGVRKKRPRYSDGPFLLSLNDVLNAVVCPSSEEEGDGSDDETFQRFGITDDGIDLAYDSQEGTLQISLRYRKFVVTNESLHSLADVGVMNPRKQAHHLQSGNDVIRNIIPGMEFIDGKFVMRIHEVRDAAVHAKKVYMILDSSGRTSKVNALEIVVYRDVETVLQKIHEMLE